MDCRPAANCERLAVCPTLDKAPEGPGPGWFEAATRRTLALRPLPPLFPVDRLRLLTGGSSLECRLQLIDSAVAFAKRQFSYKIDGPQTLSILSALESRTPIAQFRGTLETSCREAEVLVVALKSYSETFRSAKHQSLLQELRQLTARLANSTEGRRTPTYPRQPRINPKNPAPYW